MHKVTVPGPINADVTIIPGPMFLKAFNIIILLTSLMHQNQGTMTIFQIMD